MSRCSASDTQSANSLSTLKSIEETYCHIEGEVGIYHKSRHVASIRTLWPIAEGEKEAWEQDVDVGILKGHTMHDACEEVVGPVVHGHGDE